MKNFNEKYRKRQFISRDKWSDTYKAVNSVTKEIVTLKVLNIQNQEEIKNIQSKIETLKEMESPNLISINSMESFVESEKTYYYIECEDFAGKKISEISEVEGFDSVEAIKIMRQVAEGLKEFHFKSFTYGNLDCEDIYVDNNGLVKLDTTAYLKNINANEDLEEEFSEEEDIFSLGVILFKLVTDNSEFKVGKCKNYISDSDLINIIDRATNHKVNTYADLNEFISDANAYIEYGGTSYDNGSSGYYEEDYEEGGYDGYDDYESEDDYYESGAKKLIKRIVACVAVLLIIITAVKGVSLLNAKKKDASQDVSQVVSNENIEPKEEEDILDEEALEEEIAEDEDTEDTIEDTIEDITEADRESTSYYSNYNNQEEYENTNSNNTVNSSINSDSTSNNNSSNSSNSSNNSNNSTNSNSNSNSYRPNNRPSNNSSNNTNNNNSNSNNNSNNSNNNNAKPPIKPPSNGDHTNTSDSNTTESGEENTQSPDVETSKPETTPDEDTSGEISEESSESQLETE